MCKYRDYGCVCAAQEEVPEITRQRYVNELSNLLGFMSSWDREAKLAEINAQLDAAADPEALLESFGSPTRMAVGIAHDYIPTAAPGTGSGGEIPIEFVSADEWNSEETAAAENTSAAAESEAGASPDNLVSFAEALEAAADAAAGGTGTAGPSGEAAAQQAEAAGQSGAGAAEKAPAAEESAGGHTAESETPAERAVSEGPVPADAQKTPEAPAQYAAVGDADLPDPNQLSFFADAPSDGSAQSDDGSAEVPDPDQMSLFDTGEAQEPKKEAEVPAAVPDAEAAAVAAISAAIAGENAAEDNASAETGTDSPDASAPSGTTAHDAPGAVFDRPDAVDPALVAAFEEAEARTRTRRQAEDRTGGDGAENGEASASAAHTRRLRVWALIPCILLFAAIALPIALVLVCIGLPVLALGAALIAAVIWALQSMLPALTVLSDVLLLGGGGAILAGLGLLLAWLGIWISISLGTLWLGSCVFPLASKLCFKEVPEK